MLKRFGIFLISVMQHWRSLGAFVLLQLAAFFRLLFPDDLQKRIDPYIPAHITGIAQTAAVVLLLIACFRAWDDETAKAEELRSEVAQLTAELERLKKAATEPRLFGQIVGVAFGPPTEPFDAVIQLMVTNLGAPTSVDGFSLSIDPPDKAGWAILPVNTLYIDNPKNFPESMMAQLIEKEEKHLASMQRQHWRLRFTIPHILNRDATRPGTKWVVGFSDIAGKGYEAEHTFPPAQSGAAVKSNT